MLSSIKFYLLIPLILCSIAKRTHAVFLTDPSKLPTTEYDFVIIGGGTAGSAIASRLSEDPSVDVLVIEAGRSNTGDDAVPIQVPFLSTAASPNTVFDWNYTTIPQVGLNGRSIAYPRGFVLGGSSSINFMSYTRCSKDDYDLIAQVAGDDGWSWDNMFPYLLKTEMFVEPADHHNTTGQFDPSVHGFKGPILTSLPGFAADTDGLVINTTNELPEFPFNLDTNSGDPLGVGWMQSTIGHGSRSSSATGYIDPVLPSRPNLDILIHTYTTQLIQTGFNGSTPSFRGVNISQSSTAPQFQITARKEVILSAGSIGTPQILMLSGIGDQEELSAVGIKTIVDLPDVGKNMQDQTLLPLQWTVNSNMTFDPIEQDPAVKAADLQAYFQTHTGVLANSPAGNQAGFFRLPSNSSILSTFGDPTAGSLSPHYEMVYGNGFVTAGQAIPTSGSFFSIVTAFLSPMSRGSVTIQSSSVFDHPLIDPALLAEEFDILTVIESVKAALRFVSASSWKDYIIAPFFDASNFTTDAGIEAYARTLSTTFRHPVGTAGISKATDNKGVTGPDLKVKGTSGLRVVDASIIPFAIGGHPQAAIYAIAERTADLIKTEYHIGGL